ncbi:MAG TPA: hypothetical protein VFO62_07460 [Candidatus Binatia bacterium]|nr:hypothetical protein [Candidatus Binatia bacterium]
MRPRSILTVFLVALWLPTQGPCASALALLGHDGDEAHDAALSWEHGHLHLVLQHSRPGDTDDARVTTRGVTLGVAPQGHGTDHADHVLHPVATDQFIRAATSDLSSYAFPHSALADVSYRAIPPRDDCNPRGNQARARSSPTLNILRSTILLI